ncbi:MAG TPA: TlpA disulfide reductase family protein [Rubricoccaceae bacterium]|jgi:thiol-disulfide isomerase/thioredoxin
MIRSLVLSALALAATTACAQGAAEDLRERAYQAVLDTPGFSYGLTLRYTDADTSWTTEANVVTAAPGGFTRARIETPDETAAWDGAVFRVVFPRTHRVYVDSTGEKAEEGVFGLASFHPTFGLRLAHIENQANKVSLGPNVDVGGRPCRRVTYAMAAPGAPAVDIGVCYDDALALPSQITISQAASGSRIEMTFSDIRAVDAPDASVFAPDTPPGYSAVPYDQSGAPLVAVGAPAPPFSLAADDGTPVRLDAYAGQVVLLDFWGTWCGPCVQALPGLQALHRAYPDLVVLGLAAYEDADADPTAFARQRGATYPIVRAPESVVEAYLVRAFPTYYLIGPDGAVRFTAVHDDDPDAEAHLRTAVADLLGPPR